METKSTNGILNPRLYQVFGDRIDSKQAMEPLAIATGPGPVTGFNAFSWDPENNTVTFSSFNDYSQRWFNEPRKIKDLGYTDSGGGYKTISDPSNTSGDPINAHITRDGLLHTCHKITLPFTPSNGWPSVRYDGAPIDNTPSKGVWFGLKAKHQYLGQSHSVIDNPVTFEVFEFGQDPFSFVSNHSYSSLCQLLNTNGILDTNTETLIGFYIIGWDNSWEQNEWSKYYKALINDLGWCLSLVFYHSSMPHLAQTPFDLDRCRRITDKVEYLTSQSIGTILITIQSGTISVFKLTYRDREITLGPPDEPTIDNRSLSDDGSGYFEVIFTVRSIQSTMKIDPDTIIAQSTIEKSFIDTLPRIELTQAYTENIEGTPGTGIIFGVKYHLRFWADPGSDVLKNTINIRGILRIEDRLK